MSRSPLISVIMSVYNGASFLRESVDSILKQSFTDFEFIIVDDGSTDGSKDIIRSYSDERIVFIPLGENKGLIYALNLAIENSRGKYIARMDADDIALENRLALQVDAMEQDSSAILCHSAYLSFSDSKSVLLKLELPADGDRAFLLFSNSICHPTVMMNGPVLRNLNAAYRSEFKHTEDYDLWTRLALMGKFFYLSTPLIKYRDHAAQVSHTKLNEQIPLVRKIRENYFQQLGFKLNPAQLDKLHTACGNTLLNNLSDLTGFGAFLKDLHYQNRTRKIFSESTFDFVLDKIWYDACGHTVLGLAAYKAFSKVKFNSAFKASKLRLLVKCLVRRFT